MAARPRFVISSKEYAQVSVHLVAFFFPQTFYSKVFTVGFLSILLTFPFLESCESSIGSKVVCFRVIEVHQTDAVYKRIGQEMQPFGVYL